MLVGNDEERIFSFCWKLFLGFGIVFKGVWRISGVGKLDKEEKMEYGG